MINIYLIRHGMAVERQDYLNDSDRPLTEPGRQKTTKVAQRLLGAGVRFTLIQTSPLVRARETAEILSRQGLSEKIETCSYLSPGGNLEDWLDWWGQSSYNQDNSELALVGHQPNLGNWSETLVWGSSQEKLVVKKAGVIGLKVPRRQTLIGNCELFLLTSPKWLLTG